MEKSKLRRWLVVQKIILLRGYGWVNTPMIGVIFVGAVKTIFPSLVSTTTKAIGWGALGLVVMYLVGYIDRKFRLFHEENDYITESMPHLMGMIDRSKDETDK